MNIWETPSGKWPEGTMEAYEKSVGVKYWCGDDTKAQQELGEEELDAKFQSLKKDIKPEHLTFVAEDLENNFLGFFWAYKSKGDLGEKSYVWLLDIGVVPGVKGEGVISVLLKKLEEETIKLELNTIRTGVHCSNKGKAMLFKNIGYEISNHFMYKSLFP